MQKSWGGVVRVARVAPSTDPPSMSNQCDSLMLMKPSEEEGGGGGGNTTQSHKPPQKHFRLLGVKGEREKCL